MNVSQTMSRLIEEAISKLTPEPIGHVNFDGIKYEALPVFGTIGEVWLLRPDGSFWRSDCDSGLPLEPLPQDLHTMALVAGTKRYEWLKELLPPRPAAAVDCSDCRGSGRLGPEGVVFCRRCDALGWQRQARQD
jgi:hypothetical protein